MHINDNTCCRLWLSSPLPSSNGRRGERNNMTADVKQTQPASETWKHVFFVGLFEKVTASSSLHTELMFLSKAIFHLVSRAEATVDVQVTCFIIHVIINLLILLLMRKLKFVYTNCWRQTYFEPTIYRKGRIISHFSCEKVVFYIDCKWGKQQSFKAVRSTQDTGSSNTKLLHRNNPLKIYHASLSAEQSGVKENKSPFQINSHCICAGIWFTGLWGGTIW